MVALITQFPILRKLYYKEWSFWSGNITFIASFSSVYWSWIIFKSISLVTNSVLDLSLRCYRWAVYIGPNCPTRTLLGKKGVVRWDLEGPISSAYLAHRPHPFFMSIRIEFSASYSMLSQSFVTPTSLASLFINPKFSQCPLGLSCQLPLFWYL